MRRRSKLGKRLAPYALSAPGAFWLGLFFLVPIAAMLSVSLQTGSIDTGFRMTWHFAEYPSAISRYHRFFLRSLQYGGTATLADLAVAYPMAYWIAFHGGRRKTTFLLLLLLPFFVSFVIRSVAWQFILSDEGIVLGTLKSWHLLPSGFHVLDTGPAVVAGIAYNFLPFMALPLYVSLEKIDRSSILGGPFNGMIGNIIQSEYLQNFDYPRASALAFTLMIGMVVGIAAYARVLGTREIEESV